MKKILLISLCLMLMTGCGSKEENAEIAKLKEELASTKEEVAKLTDFNSEIDLENLNAEDLVKLVNSNNKEIADLKKELASAQKQIEKLSNSNPSAGDNSTADLQKLIEENNKKIEELTKNNKTLTDKVSSLEATNKTLKSSIDSLKSNSSSNTKYTITKEQLVGKWQDIVNGYEYEFTANSEVIDNWIFVEIVRSNGKKTTGALSYLYKDGILYVSEGTALKKIS